MAEHNMPKGKSFGFHSVTVGSTTVAVTLTAASVGDDAGAKRVARGAFIAVTVAPILYTLDGTDPTTVGIPAAIGDTIMLNDTTQVRGFSAVKTAANATLRAQLFR